MAEWIEIIRSAVSGAAAAALLIWLFREWISVRLKSGIQHEYDQKLEAHKAQLKAEQEVFVLNIKTAVARETALHAAGHASFSEGQKASMERKLNGIDRLWAEVLRFRNCLPPVIGFMDILTVDEYRGAKDHPDFRALSQGLSQETIMGFASASSSIEEIRPYVGEYLWSVYGCYQAVLLRLLLLLCWGRSDADKMEWHKDGGIRQLIGAVLKPSEVEEFDQKTFGKVGWLKQRLESKILAATQKVVSGEAFGADSLKQAMELQERVAQLSMPDSLRPAGL